MTNSNLRDWLQVLTWITAVVGGGIAAFKALFETREGRKQRKSELQWRRVNASKELVEDLHRHEMARQALHMLDWYASQSEYSLGGAKVSISYQDVIRALALRPEDCKGDRDTFIRDCFDWFFYFIDRIQHYIGRDLIEFPDVAPIFKTYARLVGKDWDVYESFLSFHDYELAKNFFGHYPEFFQTQKLPKNMAIQAAK
jgi:hypothetical protein